MKAAREAQAGEAAAPDARHPRNQARCRTAPSRCSTSWPMSRAIPSSCRGSSRRACSSDSDTEMVADMLVGFKALREKFTSRVIKDRPNRLEVIYIDGPMRDLDNVWHFRPLRRRRLRDRLLRRFRVQEQDVRDARRAVLRPRLPQAGGRVRDARRRALRQQQLERAKRRLKAHAGAVLVRRTAAIRHRACRCRAPRARTPRCRPACSRLPPSGPAMPLIATATSALLRSSAPCGHRVDAGDRNRAERVEDVARRRRGSRAWPRSNRSRTRGRAPPRSPAISVIAAATSPPVQLSATATLRPAARVLLDHAGARARRLRREAATRSCAARTDRHLVGIDQADDRADQRRRRLRDRSAPWPRSPIRCAGSCATGILAEASCTIQRIDQRAHRLVGQGADHVEHLAALRSARPGAEHLEHAGLGARPDPRSAARRSGRSAHRRAGRGSRSTTARCRT